MYKKTRTLESVRRELAQLQHEYAELLYDGDLDEAYDLEYRMMDFNEMLRESNESN